MWFGECLRSNPQGSDELRETFKKLRAVENPTKVFSRVPLRALSHFDPCVYWRPLCLLETLVFTGLNWYQDHWLNGYAEI